MRIDYHTSWLFVGVVLRTDQAKRLNELERENGRLKRLLAGAELDKAILLAAANPSS